MRISLLAASSVLCCALASAAARPGAVAGSSPLLSSTRKFNELAVRSLEPAAFVESSVQERAKAVAEMPVGGATSPLVARLKMGVLFFLWYALNVAYNITNKSALKRIRVPWTIAAVQLVIGALYMVPIWASGFRKAPVLDKEALKTLFPIAFCHAASHASAVIGLGAGAISFVHIVKAMEPFFTALFSAIFLKQIFPLPVYLALVPVVGGVGIASFHGLAFNWVAFGGAMGSNIAASIRGIFAKKSMGKPKGENMGAANLYAVLTIMAAAMLLPLAAIFEGPKLTTMWDQALAKGASPTSIIMDTVLSGLWFYLYNEVAFMCLEKVHPVTHAVANTFKRVFIIGTGVVIFGDKLTGKGLAGSAVAVIAVLVYSLLKDYYAKQAIQSKVVKKA